MRPGPSAEYNLPDYGLLCPDMENVPEGVLRLGLMEGGRLEKERGKNIEFVICHKNRRKNRKERIDCCRCFVYNGKRLSTVSMLLIPNATGSLFVASNVFSHVYLSVHGGEG